MGDAIGSTGRYAQAHRDVPGQKYFIATSDATSYYDWGGPSAALERVSLFSAPKVNPTTVDPTELSRFSQAPPFALFMRRTNWLPVASQLAERYPRGRIRNVTPDGTHVVLEVPAG